MSAFTQPSFSSAGIGTSSSSDTQRPSLTEAAPIIRIKEESEKMSGQGTTGSALERLLVAEKVLRQSSDHIALEENSLAPNFATWRESLTQWFYDVVDNRNEPRSVVYVAMNILDRYIAVKCMNNITYHSNNVDVLPINDADKNMYKMAAMTAIFLAVRVAGSGNLQITDVIRANGEFGVQDVICTGKKMLKTLTWGVRLVTPHDFIDVMVDYLPSCISPETKRSIVNSAYFLSELAVFDLSLSRLQASKIALAALLNGLDGLLTENDLSKAELTEFRRMLHQAACMKPEPAGICSVQSRMRSLFNNVEVDAADHGRPNYISDEEEDNDNNNDDDNSTNHQQQQPNERRKRKIRNESSSTTLENNRKNHKLSSSTLNELSDRRKRRKMSM